MRLVAYGDFNCPFSALASARLAELERRGAASVDWRAVEHAREIPAGGVPVEGSLADQLGAELAQIRDLLVDAEPDRLRLPPRQVNTRLATERYAADASTALREALFAAHWHRGDDIADPAVLDRLGAEAPDPATAEAWRAAWDAAADGLVPILVLPDGYVSRGLGALRRLAGFLADT